MLAEELPSVSAVQEGDVINGQLIYKHTVATDNLLHDVLWNLVSYQPLGWYNAACHPILFSTILFISL